MQDLELLLGGVVDALDEGGPNHWTEGPVPSRAMALDAVERLKAKLADVEDALRLSLTDDMDEDFTLPGVGRVKKVTKQRETWKSSDSAAQMRRDLAGKIADTVATDVLTDEVDPIIRRVALATMTEAWSVIPSFAKPLVKAIDVYGIHPSDYRTWNDYETVVIDPSLEEG